jgi:hypothetical protein
VFSGERKAEGKEYVHSYIGTTYVYMERDRERENE